MTHRTLPDVFQLPGIRIDLEYTFGVIDKINFAVFAPPLMGGVTIVTFPEIRTQRTVDRLSQIHHPQTDLHKDISTGHRITPPIPGKQKTFRIDRRKLTVIMTIVKLMENCHLPGFYIRLGNKINITHMTIQQKIFTVTGDTQMGR